MRLSSNLAICAALMFCFGGFIHWTNARCGILGPSEAFRDAAVVFLGKVVSIDDPQLPAPELQFRMLGQDLTRTTVIKPDELTELVREQISTKAKPALGVVSEPTYVLSDFNGDGFTDIAIVVVIEEGRDELKNHGVRFIDVDPFSRTNGSDLDPNDQKKMWKNCLGLVFLNGSEKEWNPRAISDKFIIYDCFSSIRRLPKNVPIRRGRRSTGPPPRLKGDGILLDLESGAQSLVYWDGKTYRGFSIRRGD